MSTLDISQFVEFFYALWEKEPFAWQVNLARRVLENDVDPWPQAIALPTAAGKTACMDIAVFALACQANRLHTSRPFSAPRRIFFVVDRRVIVDEAFNRAKTLANKLHDARAGILKQIGDALRKLAGSDRPLAAFQLRGGILRSDAWAKSPTQPLVVAGTVDQVGSRLLFRAYGPGHGMRPIHAGLVGNDSLILLDEAHCAQPFLETLQAVSRYRRWAGSCLPSPFCVTIMSATPPPGLNVFRDESQQGKDPNHPLGRRQLASKPARLVIAKKAKGKVADVVKRELAKVLVEQSRFLVREWMDQRPDSPPATVLFCNRVDTARMAHQLLTEIGENVILLTGRMRPVDKDEIIDKKLVDLSAENSSVRRLAGPKYVIATQTLEVGANLDFDLLVTECASMDALRQRFGRLNRMGREIPAHAVIVVRDDQCENSETDPVYGAALTSTWKWLQSHIEDGIIDFGIHKLAQRMPTDQELSALNAPSRHAPVLLPAHVDVLAQTAPEPWPSPEVALFLHGPESGPADVQVCWRADLTGDSKVWTEVLTLCPPAAPECLSVPFGLMRRWLAGSHLEAGADVEGQADEDDRNDAVSPVKRLAVRWLGRRQAEVIRDPKYLKPGDILVIPASLGGWSELGALPGPVIADWGDRAYAMVRDRAILRLHHEILRQWPGSEAVQNLVKSGPARLAEEGADILVDDLKTALNEWKVQLEGQGWEWLKTIVDGLTKDKKLSRSIFPHPTGGLFLLGNARLNRHEMLDAPFSDEDDESSSGNCRSLLLSESNQKGHLQGVAEHARRNAQLCGLPKELVAILEAAGKGHDLGKADPRFQAWLKGGNPWARGPLLAKSADMAQGREESRKARERAGYPQGGRHELLSVRLLESVPAALPEDEALRDLLLHLVESHHGHCRPFAPVVEDSKPVQVKLVVDGHRYTASSDTGLERLDAGPAERYWHLTQRYGWWGLAWLEAMLRLADHRRSEWEELHAGEV